MYKYETHLHTYPVSRCAHVSVEDNLKFYKEKGYDGVFITNHFLDGNINIDRNLPFEERVNFYFSDYENATLLSNSVGIKVFLGIELSYKGTDFLVYGIDKNFILAHPEIEAMSKKEELQFFIDNGGYIIQAHPFRDSSYIDHVRLFPAQTNGVEIINASRPDFENGMAKLYAQYYDKTVSAGSDNHAGKDAARLAGVMTEKPLNSVYDFIEAVKNRQVQIFLEDNI